MSPPADREIIARWRAEPAPLLPLLHAFHDRDGYLSESALRATAQALRIPLADLYGTVTFYHHFARAADLPQRTPRVCTGPVCRLPRRRGTARRISRRGRDRDALRRPLR